MNTSQSTFDTTQPLVMVTEEVQEEKPQFSHDQLLKALYWCYDIFDRANMQFLLIYDTGKQVKDNELLSGDHIDIGIRRLEWESGGKRIFDAFIDQDGIKEAKEEDRPVYIAEGVPVVVHILEEDACLTQPDTVMYHMEDFKLPNPYERFEQKYGSNY